MRVIALMFLAVGLLASRGVTASAQTPTPDKGGTPRSIGRTGTLSPDEERRAARAHARAASAAKTTPGHKTGLLHATEAPAAQLTSKTPSEPAPGAHIDEKGSRPIADHARAAREMSQDRHARGPATDRARLASRPEVRHARLPEHARPYRRAVAGGYRWSPRVGDVVPAGVALYPLPPGYQPGYAGGGEDALPGRDYVQPAYPPFPRVHDGPGDD